MDFTRSTIFSNAVEHDPAREQQAEGDEQLKLSKHKRKDERGGRTREKGPAQAHR